MSVSEIIAACESLYLDLDFSYVKEWKEKHGAKVIGFMPVYVPRELIHAYGMLPVGIMGGGENLEIIKGDAYYQSYICHIPRSTIELGLNGQLDCLDGLLFPAICDVIRNLSGMWKLLFKDKYVKYLDFPQNFREDIGGVFYRQELELLRADFASIAGRELANGALNEAIELYNENRRMIEKLYALRSARPHLVPTSELYLLMRVSNLLEVTEHTRLLARYIEAVGKEERPERDNVRVVLTGAFCEQPPLALVRALEQSGCFIVEDDWVLGARYLEGDIETSDDPLEAIAAAYLKRGVPTASRYEDREKKGAYLVRQVKTLEAEGVVFAAPSFCDPALLESPMLQQALERENIPFTAFKYAEDTGQFQVIKEQTGTFVDAIKLWGDEPRGANSLR